MTMGGSADVAFLDGAGPVGVVEDAVVVDVEVGESLANAGSVEIGPHDTDEGNLGARSAQHGGDAAGPAQALFALVGVQQDDGGFLTDTLGVAPYIAVQHQIAQHQDMRLAEVLDKLYQVRRHAILHD